MDPLTVSILVGLATLLIERGYKFAMKIKSSSCCGVKLKMDDSPDSPQL